MKRFSFSDEECVEWLNGHFFKVYPGKRSSIKEVPYTDIQNLLCRLCYYRHKELKWDDYQVAHQLTVDLHSLRWHEVYKPSPHLRYNNEGSMARREEDPVGLEIR